MSTDSYYQELFDYIKKTNPSKDKYVHYKMRLCKKHGIQKIPSDIEVSLNATEIVRKRYKNLLSIKPTREHSGVNVVAVMTKPHKCPHGKCDICPGGPQSFFGDVPQSYTGKEPATRRAIRNEYDPYLQVWNRLEQYIAMNIIPDKIELIIMGGTFPSMPRKYQTEFIKYCFKAMNDFSMKFKDFDIEEFKRFFELPGDINDKEREERIKIKIMSLKRRSSLIKEQEKNESVIVRCVGLTIETRPDFAKLNHANFLLKLGCTRVELGVQSIDDKVLTSINRGHTVEETIKATKTLKDLGFKINYHIMPGLPKTTKKQEIENFIELFTNSDFQPDMLKIYPCMVMEGTKLYDDWKKGRYKPLTTKEAAELISEFKRFVPQYVRIMRVQRDIPTFATTAGVDRTNLRQYVDELCKKKGIRCQCIRCREIKQGTIEMKKTKYHVMHYQASGGIEFFIQAIYNDRLVGFCRMRFPGGYLRPEIIQDSALIRELHVFGHKEEIGKEGKVQHKGIGKNLMSMAEKIAFTYYKKKMIVISAVGTRQYYQKIGYHQEGPYMVKKLSVQKN